MRAVALHPDFDETRWIEASGYEGRLFLGFNPHTFLGRIGVWSEALDQGTSISAPDVTAASETARAWIDGYLAGNEPSARVMFGSDIYDLPDDHPRWQRWRAALDRFRRTGIWNGGLWSELTPISHDVDLVVPAWTWQGDEVWVWSGQDWRMADHQPALDGTATPDEGCDHSMAVIDDRHLQCEKCGLTNEAAPD